MEITVQELKLLTDTCTSCDNEENRSNRVEIKEFKKVVKGWLQI